MQPNGPSGNWKLVWHDEFSGTSIDRTKWNVEDGGTMRNGTPCFASNVTVSGGFLNLTLLNANSGAEIFSGIRWSPDPMPSGGYALPIGSAVEVRAKLPGDGAGTMYNWPAIWAIGDGGNSGEIDFAEVNGWPGGAGGKLTVNYHGATNNNGWFPAGSWDSAFHTFTMVRRATSFQVYYDGVLKVDAPTGDNGGAMAIVLNNSGHNAGVAHYPTTMQVDYVRAWAPA